jgi:hypothetical protein
MAIESEVPRSRRAVLAAALGAGGALVASALAQPIPVRAGTDGDVVLGADNSATATTALFVTGPRGLDVESTAGDGIRGWTDGTHVSGVFGYASDPASYGVYGKNGGRGVAALGTYGAALWASTAGYAAPLALLVEGSSSFVGKAQFSRSGRATVAKGKSYVDITVAGGLTSRSMVHATLQTYRAGVAVAAVRINYPTAGKARIYLTKVASTASSTYVGWFVAEY